MLLTGHRALLGNRNPSKPPLSPHPHNDTISLVSPVVIGLVQQKGWSRREAILSARWRSTHRFVTLLIPNHSAGHDRVSKRNRVP